MTEYFMVLDIETANKVEDALAYDIGFVVTNRYGQIFDAQSLIVREIFNDERDLMRSAYYGHKVPQYIEQLKAKQSKMVSIYDAKKIIGNIMKEYKITKVFAYNACFDKTGLDRTLRYTTKSKYRWFLPYGTQICCIWHMACQVIFTQKSFQKFALEHGFYSKSGNYQTSAEVAYRYITKNVDFDEEHKGLDDVFIETAILAHCFRQHKRMDKKINRRCWVIPTKLFGKVCQ